MHAIHNPANVAQPTQPNAVLHWLFFNLIVRPVMTLLIGLNVRRAERLPVDEPCIIVANHNSHLDTMALMMLMPARQLRRVRPVAAADYFMRPGLVRWFATRVLGILPIARKRSHPDQDLLADCKAALDRGETLILFPEGSRGEPEQMSELKSGIARLAEYRPEIPVIPVFMHGLGKALPKGESLLVPFFCDVFVGTRQRFCASREAFMAHLQAQFASLRAEACPQPWL